MYLLSMCFSYQGDLTSYLYLFISLCRSREYNLCRKPVDGAEGAARTSSSSWYSPSALTTKTTQNITWNPEVIDVTWPGEWTRTGDKSDRKTSWISRASERLADLEWWKDRKWPSEWSVHETTNHKKVIKVILQHSKVASLSFWPGAPWCDCGEYFQRLYYFYVVFLIEAVISFHRRYIQLT